MSFGEMFFLLFLALMVFGPKRLPEMARKLGKIVGEFKRASNDFRAQIEDEVRKLELTDAAQSIGMDFKQATQSITRTPSFDDQSRTALDPQILPPSAETAVHLSSATGLLRDDSFDAALEPSPEASSHSITMPVSAESPESESQHV